MAWKLMFYLAIVFVRGNIYTYQIFALLFCLSFDRFGNVTCEIIEPNWASMGHGLSYLK